jgi:DNA-binding transcriptional LysR family regulator
MPWRLQGPRQEVLVRPRAVVLADEMGFVQAAVVAGAGIGLLPIHQTYRVPGLVRLFPRYGLRGGGLYVVWPSREYVPARVQLFREHLITELTAVFSRCPGPT